METMKERALVIRHGDLAQPAERLHLDRRRAAAHRLRRWWWRRSSRPPLSGNSQPASVPTPPGASTPRRRPRPRTSTSPTASTRATRAPRPVSTSKRRPSNVTGTLSTRHLKNTDRRHRTAGHQPHLRGVHQRHGAGHRLVGAPGHLAGPVFGSRRSAQRRAHVRDGARAARRRDRDDPSSRVPLRLPRPRRLRPARRRGFGRQHESASAHRRGARRSWPSTCGSSRCSTTRTTRWRAARLDERAAAASCRPSAWVSWCAAAPAAATPCSSCDWTHTMNATNGSLTRALSNVRSFQVRSAARRRRELRRLSKPVRVAGCATNPARACLQVGAERLGELRVRQRVFHVGLQIPQLAAAVEALALEACTHTPPRRS